MTLNGKQPVKKADKKSGKKPANESNKESSDGRIKALSKKQRGMPEFKTFEYKIQRKQTSGNRGAVYENLPEHTEAGHLVGLKLGGPDETANLVPMYSTFNQKYWRIMEDEIYNNRNITEMKVEALKASENSKLPSIFIVKVKERDKKSGRENDVWKDYALFDMQSKKHKPRAPKYKKMNEAHKEQARKILKDAREEMQLKGWKLENEGSLGICVEKSLEDRQPSNEEDSLRIRPRRSTHKPPKNQNENGYAKLKLPEGKRPYEVLDYLYIKHPEKYHALKQALLGKMDPADTFKFQSGGTFTEEQRKMILRVNYLDNGDKWLSDEIGPDEIGPDEKKRIELLRHSTSHAPQIDHIFPWSRSGSNTFSNAQVLAAMENQKKSNSSGQSSSVKRKERGSSSALAEDPNPRPTKRLHRSTANNPFQTPMGSSSSAPPPAHSSSSSSAPHFVSGNSRQSGEKRKRE